MKRDGLCQNLFDPVSEMCSVSMQKESSIAEATKGKGDSLHKVQEDEGAL